MQLYLMPEESNHLPVTADNVPDWLWQQASALGRFLF
jgi:hypothetical protein